MNDNRLRLAATIKRREKEKKNEVSLSRSSSMSVFLSRSIHSTYLHR